MQTVMFDGWSSVWRIAIVGILAYIALVAMLRVSGKRTLAKMNAFDLVVTVAIGSILATVLLSPDVSLVEGVTAYLVLIVMQYLIAWLSVRVPFVSHLVKSEPRLLFYQGSFIRQAMRAERVTEGDVRAAVRAQGAAALDDVVAVVLENDGTMTVVLHNGADHTALADVSGVDHRPLAG